MLEEKRPTNFHLDRRMLAPPALISVKDRLRGRYMFVSIE
jgi:hypothetical protein